MQQYPPPPPEQQPPSEGYPSPYQSQPAVGMPAPGYAFQPLPPQANKNAALKYGFIFGAVLFVLDAFQTIINMIITPILLRSGYSLERMGATSLIIAAIFTLIYWTIYFFTGFLTIREAQQMKSAILACIWAGVCYAVIRGVIVAFNVVSALPNLIAPMIPGYLTSVAINVAITLAINVGLGIGIGALGGLLGKKRTQQETPPLYQ